MDVMVAKNGMTHICHSEEQLNRFLMAGWVKETEPAEKVKPKKKTSK